MNAFVNEMMKVAFNDSPETVLAALMEANNTWTEIFYSDGDKPKKVKDASEAYINGDWCLILTKSGKIVLREKVSSTTSQDYIFEM